MPKPERYRLAEKLEQKIKDNEQPIVKHFKGNKYKVLTIAKHTENNKYLIIYEDLIYHKVYARPYHMFFEVVKRDGNEYHRFNFIKEDN